MHIVSHSSIPTLAGKTLAVGNPKATINLCWSFSSCCFCLRLPQWRCTGQSITRLMVGTYWRAVVPFLLVHYNEGSSKCYSDGCLRWRVAGVTAAPSCSLLKRVRGTGETWVFVRSSRDLALPLPCDPPLLPPRWEACRCLLERGSQRKCEGESGGGGVTLMCWGKFLCKERTRERWETNAASWESQREGVAEGEEERQKQEAN